MLILLLLACTGAPPSPSASMPSVSDPRAYVRDAVLNNDSNWLKAPWLNPDDPALIEPWLDKRIGKDLQIKGELPSDQRKLDRFVQRIQSAYLTDLLKTDEGRAAVEERIRERFENPVITMDEGIAVADLGFVPGPFEKALRSGYRIKPDRLEDGETPTADIVRAFNQAHEAHPDAKGWRLKVVQYIGSSKSHFTYAYQPGGHDRLLVRKDPHKLKTREPIGGVEGLLKGGYPTNTKELANAAAEWNLLNP